MRQAEAAGSVSASADTRSRDTSLATDCMVPRRRSKSFCSLLRAARGAAASVRDMASSKDSWRSIYRTQRPSASQSKGTVPPKLSHFLPHLVLQSAFDFTQLPYLLVQPSEAAGYWENTKGLRKEAYSVFSEGPIFRRFASMTLSLNALHCFCSIAIGGKETNIIQRRSSFK